jgi:hypothetical protein
MNWNWLWPLLIMAVLFALPWYLQTLARAWTLGRLEGVGLFTMNQVKYTKEKRNGESE